MTVAFLDYDIIAVTETWLQLFIYDNELFPEGYTICRKDTFTGGGVLIDRYYLVLRDS